MYRAINLILAMLLLGAAGAAGFAQADPKTFDLSGVPNPPKTFKDQQVLARVDSANRYNTPAMNAQAHKFLSDYYQEKGDKERADAERLKAQYWQNGGAQRPSPPAGSQRPSDTPRHETTESCEAANPKFAGNPAPLEGTWYLQQDPTQTFRFWGDSFFDHIWKVTGNIEMTHHDYGRFQISGNRITLHVTSRRTTFAAISSVGAGLVCKDEMQRASMQILGSNGDDGLVLDDMTFKKRTW